MNDRLKEENLKTLFPKLVIPAVMSQLITLLYNIVDRIYIGRIPDVGSVALTGVGICTPALLMVTAIVQLICVGGAPRMSFFMGQGDHDNAERTLGCCAFLLVILGAVITVVVRVFSEKIVFLFGGTEETIPYALEYLNIYILGTVFSLFASGMVFFITAQGHSKITLISVALGAGLNTVLDPIMIYTLNMGIAGAAVATVISQIVSTVWSLLFLTSKKCSVSLKVKRLQLDFGILLPVLWLGLAPFVQVFTESILSLSFNRTLLRYGGNIAVGAMTIFSTIVQFFSLPVIGISQGAQPILSYNQGAGNNSRVSQCSKITMKTIMFFSVAIWLLIHLIPQVFINVFTTDTELKTFALPMMHVFFAMLFAMGIQIGCQQIFVALGKATISLFLALLRKVILLIPLIFILPLIFGGKIWSVYLAEPVSDTLASITTGVMFIICMRQYTTKNQPDN